MSILLYMYCCWCTTLSWFMREITIDWHLVKADGQLIRRFNEKLSTRSRGISAFSQKHVELGPALSLLDYLCR